jgi:predicted phosphodiesterase
MNTCLKTGKKKVLLRIMEGANADIMCFGHTHKPYHRILPAEEGDNSHYRHAINIGSGRQAKDNNPKGCYVMLTINSRYQYFKRRHCTGGVCPV